MRDGYFEDAVLALLPAKVSAAVYQLKDDGVRIDEVRLRADRAVTVTTGGENIALPCRLTKDELSAAVFELCGKSVYAHEGTIREGYIILPNGVRAGICGTAVTSDGRITAVRDFTGVNIRIPHRHRDAGRTVADVFERLGFSRGILIYSLPGVGKTTALREFCAAMQGRRIVLVDSRGEMGFCASENPICDILSGYPRGPGVEIALRTMNPQGIVTDEISAASDGAAAEACLASGVPLIASIHGDSVGTVLSSPIISRGHMLRLFGAFIGIKREEGQVRYEVTYTDELGD